MSLIHHGEQGSQFQAVVSQQIVLSLVWEIAGPIGHKGHGTDIQTLFTKLFLQREDTNVQASILDRVMQVVSFY